MDFPIELGEYSYNLCLTFPRGSSFTAISKTKITPIIFNECTIKEFKLDTTLGNVYFSKCDIGIVETKRLAQLSYLIFYGGDVRVLKSNKTEVRFLTFMSTTIGFLNFNESAMSHSKFFSATFQIAPSFLGTKMDRTVFFNQCKFIDFRLDSQPYYRELRALMQDNHDEINAIFFHGLELKSKHHQLKFKEARWDWITSSLFKIINNFNLNVYRPIGLLLGLYFISFLLYLIFCKFNWMFVAQPQYGMYIQALNLAFISIVGPLRILGKFDPPELTLFGGIIFWLANVLSAVLWFFLIFGVRKRFKLS